MPCKWSLLAASVLMAGCADSFGQFYHEAQQYKGHDIDDLIDRIGDPDSQTFIAGRVVYTWTPASTLRRQSQLMRAPPEGAPEPSVPLASAQPQALFLQFRCALRADTDGAGNILSLAWEGKPESCAP